MRTTQHNAIIKHIKDNGFISSYVAAVKLGVSNLPQRIRELKAKGYTIATRKKAHVNRYGNLTHYVEYYLKAENQGTTAQKQKGDK